MEAGMVLGTETEYTVSTVPDSGSSHEDCVSRFLYHARHRLKNLPQDGDGSGIFVANGGRLYPDLGHIEYASPETITPRDLVLYQAAGKQIMQDLSRTVEESYSGRPVEVVVTHASVDYFNGTTQGSHENYSFGKPALEEPEELLPFLASRVIFCGAGGFNNLITGLEFVVSPRALHIETPVSTSTTRHRPLYHFRHESLTGVPHMSRIHLICGEHLCCATSSLLRFGTTGLVIKMIDAGLKPGAPVRLPKPVDALHVFAKDTTCTAAVPVEYRAPMTAIAIQRHYLELAEASFHHSWMPGWAPEICALWRRTLNQLETDPDSTAAFLDWRMKQTLYSRFLNRHNLDWDMIGWISKVITAVGAAMPAQIPVRERVHQMAAWWKEEGRLHSHPGLANYRVSPGEIEVFLNVRLQLFELDTRFSQVGARGVFAQLKAADLVREQYDAPTPTQIEIATECPPRGCRSEIRGQVIGEKWPSRQRYRCDWTRVVCVDGPLFLKLPDPFQTQASWTAEE